MDRSIRAKQCRRIASTPSACRTHSARPHGSPTCSYDLPHRHSPGVDCSSGGSSVPEFFPRQRFSAVPGRVASRRGWRWQCWRASGPAAPGRRSVRRAMWWSASTPPNALDPRAASNALGLILGLVHRGLTTTSARRPGAGSRRALGARPHHLSLLPPPGALPERPASDRGGRRRHLSIVRRPCRRARPDARFDLVSDVSADERTVRFTLHSRRPSSMQRASRSCQHLRAACSAASAPGPSAWSPPESIASSWPRPRQPSRSRRFPASYS